ncbi:MAG: hypothetical protein IPK46_18265 [Saprospiraceae bacterium]|nr:hypothetical protein [Saprospiraceae bacterium]
MDSEEQRTKELLIKVAELERVIGQKQLEIDYLDKLIELSGNDLGIDLKKKAEQILLNGLERGKVTMQTLYLIANISRQGHFKEVLHEKTIAEKSIFYVGLMYKIREFHPGMGLRKMYEQFQPEGIGRDAWINLGLQEGFRMAPSINYYKTTYAIKSNKYENLLIKKEFTDVNQLWVSDIFYFPLNEKNYYAVLIMDVYSRKIVGGSIADNMRAENNTKALSMALKFERNQ